MNEGRERPFVSVKFAPVGRTHTFLLPDLDFDAEPGGTGVAAAARRGESRGFSPGDSVVVSTAEGPAIATVVRAIPALAERKRPGDDAGEVVLRKSSREDIVTRLKHQQREKEAHRICLLKIRERGLAMKLARVEQIFDGSRIIFYYTAEGRVDFRELVRDLAAHFHQRIEMRQIGVRDEAQDDRWLWLVWPSPLLHDVAPDVRARFDQDGEAAEAEPEPVEAVRHVRPLEVLPSLRVAERQRRQARWLC